jgi:hypothetical protein
MDIGGDDSQFPKLAIVDVWPERCKEGFMSAYGSDAAGRVQAYSAKTRLI